MVDEENIFNSPNKWWLSIYSSVSDKERDEIDIIEGCWCTYRYRELGV